MILGKVGAIQMELYLWYASRIYKATLSKILVHWLILKTKYQ